VLGLSVESDRAHTAFAVGLDLPFPLLSDFNRQIVHQFGIAYTPEQPYSGFWGMSKRSVFVVDRDGIVRYAWITEDPSVAPDVEAVLRAVEALRA
jgi:glutaredoxin-dependent peroxiredoxin